MRTYSPAPDPIDNALWRYVGFPANRGRELTLALKAGLSVDVLDNIHRWSEMSKSEILRITGINERNISRRKNADRTLSPEESERIARFVRVMDAAVQLFDGNKDDAYHWMRNPAKALGQVSPASLLSTESGALEVLDLIGRLEHGVFA
ncbi:DUF2384 domain-containing protein [Affinibrenneria salicis]|uniref:DUF2384 domain-containing protein n=1 Tax=Affinibrenneria salicis TaxID=2590031 RepID=A0A5J5G1K5_9GAMM|nr:antitoxin Xre/MbcA/ParS toxin-binding domain-containing protein [Affinibrenneria salicis]KAA9000626.1 DUF2384 domain-containing protein [Affinibrenneria salicis]